MQPAKKLKLVYSAADVLKFCRRWKCTGELETHYVLGQYNTGEARKKAFQRMQEQRAEFNYLIENGEFEHDTADDLCAILRWMQTLDQEHRFPLRHYYKLTPPEDQRTFFRRCAEWGWKGAWERKWEGFFELNILTPEDNPAFAWLALFEALKGNNGPPWFAVANRVYDFLKQFDGMPGFLVSEFYQPEGRHHYYWKCQEVNKIFALRFPLIRQWSNDPAEMILHERKCKYLIKYLMLVTQILAPVAESIYFCFPPTTLK